jgi:hypothetical protein
VDERSIAFGGIVVVAAGLTAAVVALLPRAATTPSRPAVVRAARLDLPAGPVAPSPTLAARPVAFLGGGASAAAVLVTDPAADPTAALHWLSGAGVPAAIVASPGEAYRHPLVVWTGPVAAGEAAALRRYAARGGIALLDSGSAAAMRAVGAGGPRLVPRDRLTLEREAGAGPATVPFTRAAVRGFRRARSRLASFPDGTAAIATRTIGRGALILTGVPLRTLALEPERGGPGDRGAVAVLARTLWLLTPTGVALGGAPDARTGAVVLVHPLESRAAFAGAPAMAAIEHDRGVRSTYAPVTRTTGPDTLLIAALLARLAAEGFDVEAAGVQPGPPGTLPPGTGTERYPGYAPTAARGGATTAGEARVGRHLVDAVTGAAPGVFAPPVQPGLPTAVAADAAVLAAGFTALALDAAPAVGGGLPFRPATPDGRGEVGLLHLPIAFDGAATARVDRRGDELDALAARAVATDGSVLVRLSPSGGSTAAFALQRLLADVPPAAWVGDAGSFTRFWNARYGLRLDVERAVGSLVVTLSGDGEIPAQTLVLPLPAAAARVRGSADPLHLDGTGRRVAVPAFHGRTTIEIALAPA